MYVSVSSKHDSQLPICDSGVGSRQCNHYFSVNDSGLLPSATIWLRSFGHHRSKASRLSGSEIGERKAGFSQVMLSLSETHTHYILA